MLWIAAGFGALLAVPCHEAAHVLAARLYGGRFEGVRLCKGRVLVRIAYPGTERPDLRLTALAGPLSDAVLASAMAALLPTPLKAAALWPLISAAVNLLPIQGSDGRRAFT